MLGRTISEGNRCAPDRICGPDNIRYVESIRNLLVAEDTGLRNSNSVWAFNVDTRTLARILSVPMNAEATGLTVVEDYNGFAYIMSSFQHPGEGLLPGYAGGDKAEVVAAIDRKWAGRKKAAIGYLGLRGGGALPALK